MLLWACNWRWKPPLATILENFLPKQHFVWPWETIKTISLKSLLAKKILFQFSHTYPHRLEKPLDLIAHSSIAELNMACLLDMMTLHLPCQMCLILEMIHHNRLRALSQSIVKSWVGTHVYIQRIFFFLVVVIKQRQLTVLLIKTCF